MKLRFNTSAFAALIAAALATSISTARAGHVYAGIIDTNGTAGLQAGDALSFINRTTDAVVTGASQGIQSMNLVTVGDQTGLYTTSNITFTALSNGGNGTVWDNGVAVATNAFAALTGSYIELQLSSITGPTGAAFSFWDSGATVPSGTFTIGTGWTGVDSFLLTNDGISYPGQTSTVGATVGTAVTNGIPPLDPFGHIHGRSFTVDTPGNYTVSYILHDLQGIQADSSPFVVAYATPEPGRAMLLAAGGACLLFRRRRA